MSSAAAATTATTSTSSTQNAYTTFNGLNNRSSNVSTVAETNILRDCTGKEVTDTTKYYWDKGQTLQVNPRWVQNETNQAAWEATFNHNVETTTSKTTGIKWTDWLGDLWNQVKPLVITIALMLLLLACLMLIP